MQQPHETCKDLGSCVALPFVNGIESFCICRRLTFTLGRPRNYTLQLAQRNLYILFECELVFIFHVHIQIFPLLFSCSCSWSWPRFLAVTYPQLAAGLVRWLWVLWRPGTRTIRRLGPEHILSAESSTCPVAWWPGIAGRLWRQLWKIKHRKVLVIFQI